MESQLLLQPAQFAQSYHQSAASAALVLVMLVRAPAFLLFLLHERQVSLNPVPHDFFPRFSSVGSSDLTAHILIFHAFAGGPTAAVIALQNPHISVSVVDKDTTRIARWNSKHLPIHEPGLHDIVRSARDGLRSASIALDEVPSSPSEVSARAPNLSFSTAIARSISEADVIFLSVNTPTKTMGIGAGQATNMSALEGATRDIAISAKPGAIIVEKSTVPCRTAQIIRDTVSRSPT